MPQKGSSMEAAGTEFSATMLQEVLRPETDTTAMFAVGGTWRIRLEAHGDG